MKKHGNIIAGGILIGLGFIFFTSSILMGLLFILIGIGAIFGKQLTKSNNGKTIKYIGGGIASIIILIGLTFTGHLGLAVLAIIFIGIPFGIIQLRKATKKEGSFAERKANQFINHSIEKQLLNKDIDRRQVNERGMETHMNARSKLKNSVMAGLLGRDMKYIQDAAEDIHDKNNMNITKVRTTGGILNKKVVVGEVRKGPNGEDYLRDASDENRNYMDSIRNQTNNIGPQTPLGSTITKNRFEQCTDMNSLNQLYQSYVQHHNDTVNAKLNEFNTRSQFGEDVRFEHQQYMNESNRLLDDITKDYKRQESTIQRFNGGQPNPYNQQPNPYNQQPNPYGQQPNPYGQYNQQPNPYNQRPNPYNQQYNQQPNPYNQQPNPYNQQPNPYNQQPNHYNQQPNPYNQQPNPYGSVSGYKKMPDIPNTYNVLEDSDPSSSLKSEQEINLLESEMSSRFEQLNNMERDGIDVSMEKVRLENEYQERLGRIMNKQPTKANYHYKEDVVNPPYEMGGSKYYNEFNKIPKGIKIETHEAPSEESYNSLMNDIVKEIKTSNQPKPEYKDYVPKSEHNQYGNGARSKNKKIYEDDSMYSGLEFNDSLDNMRSINF